MAKSAKARELEVVLLGDPSTPAPATAGGRSAEPFGSELRAELLTVEAFAQHIRLRSVLTPEPCRRAQDSAP